MARQARIELPGAFYHVMARGNRRGPIFTATNGDDQRLFLQTLADACERSKFRIWAWVLMRNHYHLVIETPEANLVDGMGWLQNAYTRRFNVRHKQWGRLFGDRYKSVLVESERTDVGGFGGSSYLTTLLDYIHLNPARARLLNFAQGQSILDFPWSSISGAYALSPKKRPSWMQVSGGLDLFGLKDTAAGRRKLVERLDARAVAEEARRCGLAEIEGQTLNSTLRRGWYWGSEEFKEALMTKLDERKSDDGKLPESAPYKGEGQLSDHRLRDVQRIVDAGVAHFGLSASDPGAFRDLPRGDLRSVAIAWMLWRKTSIPQKWIAEQLALRSAANVSQRVRLFDRTVDREFAKEFVAWKGRQDEF